MKKNIVQNTMGLRQVLLIIALGLLFFYTQESQAFIYSYGGEKIVKVVDLPDTEEWLADDGEYGDLSVIYKQLWILWIPLWNWDARYCGSTPSSLRNDEFLELDGDGAEFVSEYGSPEGMIPFWDRIGGKLLLAIIILVWGLNKLGKESSELEHQS